MQQESATQDARIKFGLYCWLSIVIRVFVVNDCSDDGTGALLGEPLLGILTSDSLELANATTAVLLSGNSSTGSLENDVEVHTENTSGGVILDTKIDMLINTESKVSYIN